jgi:hypothetical protein
MNFNDLILLLDSRVENLKQLASMEVPVKVSGLGTEYYKTKDGYRLEYENGIIEYINNNDRLHRTDGPAFEHPDGYKEWYVNGEQMTGEQFNRWRAKHNPIKESRSENLKQLSSMEVPYRVDEDGTETYKTKDGYRVESDNGGNIFWFNNKGRRHRVDGPAVEFADGTKYWYVNNKQHRIDGPAYIDANGGKVWWVNGKRHRIDGPAVEHPGGGKAWFVNGKYHRIDGPAIETADGSKAWYINSEPMSEQDFDKWRAKHNPIK